jgi:HSP20 family protein
MHNVVGPAREAAEIMALFAGRATAAELPAQPCALVVVLEFFQGEPTMLTRFSDFNDWPSFGFADFGRHAPHAQLRRELDRLFGDFERSVTPRGTALTFEDDGANFVLRADVPGLTENDFQISVAGNTVTLRGERKVEVPEGYSVHRRERSAVTFAKSLELPARVDADKVTATLKHGVLTLTLPKAAEAQPRQISVKAA